MALTIAQMNQRTLQILLHQELITTRHAEVIGEQSSSRGLWAGTMLVDGSHLSDRELAIGLARQFDLPLADLEAIAPDPAALACLTPECCRRYLLAPLMLRDGVLRLAVANPLQELPAELLAKPRRFGIVLSIAPLQQVRQAIDRWYGTPSTAAHASTPRTAPPAASPVQPALRGTRLIIGGDSASPDTEFAAQVHDLLAAMLEHHGTDLHLTVGMRPLMRVDGTLQPLPFSQLDPCLVQHLVYAILSGAQIRAFEQRHELDLVYSAVDGARFRVNVFRQRGAVSAIFRIIPAEIPSLASLGFSPAVHQLTQLTRGLVLVTGPAASGKSTILAAMIEEINRTRKAHIITIEDPVEIIFRPRKSEINQRLVGVDTENHATALRQALRQDPDVIMVDKLTEHETIAAAIAAAETGHLVLGALPTLGAVHTLQQLLLAFPTHMQAQVCARLANVVEGIVTQVLAPGEHAGELIYAREILIATPVIRARIHAGKLAQLPALLRAGEKEGMVLLEASLRQLRRKGNSLRAALTPRFPRETLEKDDRVA